MGQDVLIVGKMKRDRVELMEKLIEHKSSIGRCVDHFDFAKVGRRIVADAGRIEEINRQLSTIEIAIAQDENNIRE